MTKKKLIARLKLLWLPSLLLVGLLLVYFGYDWRIYFRQHHNIAIGIFILLMIFLPLIGFPISSFYLFAGMAYEPIIGFSVASLSLFVNMVIAYVLASIYKESFQRLLQKHDILKSAVNQKNLLRLTIIIRAVPGVPYWLQNYLLGVSGVPFHTYIIVSWIVQSTYLAGMIYLSYISFQVTPWKLFAGIAIIVVMVVILRVFLNRGEDK